MNEPICNDKYRKTIYEKLVNDELSWIKLYIAV